jgi:hypothetical protein
MKIQFNTEIEKSIRNTPKIKQEKGGGANKAKTKQLG